MAYRNRDRSRQRRGGQRDTGGYRKQQSGGDGNWRQQSGGDSNWRQQSGGDSNWRQKFGGDSPRCGQRSSSNSDLDVNRMFNYILTEEGGLCTVQELADGLGIDAGQIPEFVVKNGSSRMKLVQAAFPERALVVAILFDAQICTFYDECKKPNCRFFHLCRYYVTDSCSFGDDCRFSHDIWDAHNRRAVQSSGLSIYSEDHIIKVIRNSQPEVCQEYNQPSGCRAMQLGDACHKFHVCKKFVKGKCFLPDCKMDHGLTSPHNSILKVCLPKNEKILMKMMLCQSDEDSDVGGAVPKMKTKRGLGANVPRKPICHHNIERKCRYEKNKCNFDHSYDMPYMWCINLDDNWYPMDDVNTQIERAFSHPDNKKLTVNPRIVNEVKDDDDIDNITIKLKDMKFPLMTFPAKYYIDGDKKTTEVVRLSTKSYVQDISFEKKGKDGFVTVWQWFWKDNDGWKLYGVEGNPPHQDGIESQFLAKHEEIEFSYGRFSYTLYLQKGYQENEQTGTKRDVQRRPVFVSEKGVKKSLYPALPVKTCDPKAIKSGQKDVVVSYAVLPDGWRAMSADSLGFELVSLTPDSAEYKEVKQHFFKTIPSSYRIVEIKRVQNPLLYKAYVNCKAELKLKFKGAYLEEQDLFHGTKTEETAKSICFQGFDPRIHAVTAYGKGAYFARDARYSDRYTDKACCMFRSKVIVGKYVEGDSSMQRPPKLPGSDYELFDSTVNSKSDPTIYVVYDKAQCYPSHLIKYIRA